MAAKKDHTSPCNTSIVSSGSTAPTNSNKEPKVKNISIYVMKKKIQKKLKVKKNKNISDDEATTKP